MPSTLQDTLSVTEHFPAADPAALADPINIVAETTPVYGAESVRIVAQTVETVASVEPAAVSGWFQILALIVLALWCWMIYWFRDQAGMCLKGVVNFKTEDKFTAEHGHLYNIFINYAMVVMAAGMGIMIVKGISTAIGPDAISGISGWMLPPAAIVIAVLLIAVIMLQFAIMRMAGNVTMSQALTEEVMQTKKLHLAAAAILVVPPILLYTGLHPTWDVALAYIIVIELIVLTVAFVLKSLILFVRQKVSLLVWILYLCAVEIFPLSFLVLLIVKNI